VIEGTTLENLARRYMEIKAIIERWGRRYDANVLRAMMWLPEVTAAQTRRSAASAPAGRPSCRSA
jgi:hypothetical protein